MHFAYITLSLKSGSFGLAVDEAIFGMKNLHQGTVLYLPCSQLGDPVEESHFTSSYDSYRVKPIHYNALGHI